MLNTDEELPLYQSNPELFKAYVLSSLSDTVLFVHGLTEIDKILALEIKLEVIIKHIVEMSSEINKCTISVSLRGIRQQVKKLLYISHEEILRRKKLVHKNSQPLYKTNIKLFEKYVLQTVTISPQKRKKLRGLTLIDRNIKVKILTHALSKELIKLKAHLSNRTTTEIQAEFNDNVNTILQGLEQLTKLDNKN